MPDVCDIVKRTRVRQGAGTRDTQTIVASNLSCWVQKASSSEINRFMKRGININRKVYFPTDPGISVKENHQINVTSRSGVACDILMDVYSDDDPDASAGLGVLWKYMGNERTDQDE